jgi:hypothetical protein
LGQALQYALEKIDIENTDFALLKEDYCSPPLAMKRENVWNEKKQFQRLAMDMGNVLYLSLYVSHIQSGKGSHTNRLSISSFHFASSDMNN